MICPSCQAIGAEVVQTMDCDLFVNRRRQCRCGCRWTTEERLIVGTLVSLVTTNVISIGVKTPALTPVRSDPESDPRPDQRSEEDSKNEPIRLKARANGRGDATAYPAEFQEVWTGCSGYKGNKHPAFKAWLKSKPDKLLTIEMWNRWMATDGWQRGFAKHLSTWLNARGWQDEPPAEANNRTAFRKSSSEDYR